MSAPDPDHSIRDLFHRQRERTRSEAPAWSSRLLRDADVAPSRRLRWWVISGTAVAACVVVALLSLNSAKPHPPLDLAMLPELLPSTSSTESVIPLTASLLPEFESTTDFLLPKPKPIIEIL